MKVREKIIEAMEQLNEEENLKLYDFALRLMKPERVSPKTQLDYENIQRIQQLLSSIPGNLSDDISLEREDRV
ncbi:hypothetical protein WDW89_20660 [Deltaproteobacteria bacterium TL4]